MRYSELQLLQENYERLTPQGKALVDRLGSQVPTPVVDKAKLLRRFQLGFEDYQESEAKAYSSIWLGGRLGLGNTVDATGGVDYETMSRAYFGDEVSPFVAANRIAEMEKPHVDEETGEEKPPIGQTLEWYEARLTPATRSLAVKMAATGRVPWNALRQLPGDQRTLAFAYARVRAGLEDFTFSDALRKVGGNAIDTIQSMREGMALQAGGAAPRTSETQARREVERELLEIQKTGKITGLLTATADMGAYMGLAAVTGSMSVFYQFTADFNRRLIEAGVEEDIALPAATVTALPYMMVEQAQVWTALSGASVVTKLGKSGFAAMWATAMENRVAEFLVRRGLGALTEIGEEGIQQAIEETVFMALTDVVDSKEVSEQAIEAMRQSAGPMALLQALAGGVELGGKALEKGRLHAWDKRQKAIDRAVEQVLAETPDAALDAVEQAETTEDALQSLRDLGYEDAETVLPRIQALLTLRERAQLRHEDAQAQEAEKLRRAEQDELAGLDLGEVPAVEGEPAALVPPGEAAAPPVSPEQLQAQLQAEVDKFPALQGIVVEIVDLLTTPEGKPAEGLTVGGILRVLSGAADPKAVVREEIFHQLQARGILTDDELKVLRQRDAEWREQFNIDVLYDEFGEDVRTEEGQAHAFAQIQNEQERTIAKKVNDFFTALRNWFRGLGFRTPEDVLRALEGRVSTLAETQADAERRPSLQTGDRVLVPADDDGGMVERTVTSVNEQGQFTVEGSEDLFEVDEAPMFSVAQEEQVAEAARRQGYTVGPVFHGGHLYKIDFTVGPDRGRLGLVYLTDDKRVAWKYALGGGIAEGVSLAEYRRKQLAQLPGRVPTVQSFYVKGEVLDGDRITFADIIDTFGLDRIVDTLEDWSPSKVVYFEFSDDPAAALAYLAEDAWADEDTAALSNAPELRFLASSGLLPEYLEKVGKDVLAFFDAEAGGTTYVVLRPEQIKSAEAVTRDDAGEVIPLARRFDPRSPDIRFSVQQRDTEYQAAVEAGDMDTAQQMVDEAAKAAGYQHQAFHGTPSLKELQQTWAFDPERLGETTGAESAKQAFFFAGGKGTAAEYAGMDAIIPPFRGVFTPPASVNELLGDIRYIMFKAEYVPDVVWDRYGQMVDGVLRAKTPEARRAVFQEFTVLSDIEFHEIYEAAGTQVDRDAVFESVWQATTENWVDDAPALGSEEADAFLEDEAHYDAFLDAESEATDDIWNQFGGLFNRDLPSVEESPRIYAWDKSKAGVEDAAILNVALRLNNPLVHDYGKAGYRDVKFAELVARARKEGNDGVIFRNVKDGGGFDTIYAVFDPRAIKLRDPVTRDDAGEVIPLARRFDPRSPDIRFSVAQPGAAPAYSTDPRQDAMVRGMMSSPENARDMANASDYAENILSPEKLDVRFSIPDTVAEPLKAYLSQKYGATDIEAYFDVIRRFVGRMSRQARQGKSAIRANQKTLLSIDISTDCPMRQIGTPCPYCYVELPRTAKARGMSMPQSPTGVTEALEPYDQQILDMEDGLVEFLNGIGGLRMFSAGDYTPAQHDTVAKVLDHAQQKGLRIKAITKQAQLLDDFGDHPNLFVNLSTDFFPEHAEEIAKGTDSTRKFLRGEGREQLQRTLEQASRLIGHGFPLDEARRLKDQRPDRTRIRYVGINRRDSVKAVMNPDVDVVTMYHGFTKPETLRDLWRLQNPDLYANLGEEGVKQLSEVFGGAKAQTLATKITQKELDEIFGPGEVSLDEYEAEARQKVCCCTSKCATCQVACGFGVQPQEAFTGAPARVAAEGEPAQPGAEPRFSIQQQPGERQMRDAAITLASDIVQGRTPTVEDAAARLPTNLRDRAAEVLARADNLADQVEEQLEDARFDPRMMRVLREAEIRSHYQGLIDEVNRRAFDRGAFVERARQRIGHRQEAAVRGQQGLTLAQMQEAGFDAVAEFKAVLPEPPAPVEVEPEPRRPEGEEEAAPPVAAEAAEAAEPLPPDPIDPQEWDAFSEKLQNQIRVRLGIDPAVQDPAFVQSYRRTLQTVFEASAKALVPSAEREGVRLAINRLDGFRRFDALDGAARKVADRINRERVRQSKTALLKKIERFAKAKFLRGRDSATRELIKRKIDPDARRWLRLAKSVFRSSSAAADLQRVELYLNHPGIALEKQTEEEFRKELEDKYPGLRDSTYASMGMQDMALVLHKALADYGDLRNREVSEIADALASLRDAAEKGKQLIEKSIEDRQKRLAPTVEAYDAALLPKPGAKVPGVRGTGTGIAFMSILNKLRDVARFGRDSDLARARRLAVKWNDRLQKAQTQEETERRRVTKEFHDAVRDIYGRDPVRVVRDLVKTQRRYRGLSRLKNTDLSKGNLLQIYGSAIQGDYEAQAQDYDLDAIQRELSLEDMRLLAWMQGYYDRARTPLSDVSKLITGMDVISPGANYIPAAIQRDESGLTEHHQVSTIVPPSLTERRRHKLPFDETADIIGMFYSKLNEFSHYKAFAQVSTDLRGAFGTKEFQNRVRDVHGRGYLKEFMQHITDVINGRVMNGTRFQMAENALNSMRGVAAISALAGNLRVTAGQVTSIPAFGLELAHRSKGTVTGAMLNLFTPGGWDALKVIVQSEQLKNRFSTGAFEAMQNAMSNQDPKLFIRAMRRLMVTVSAGDVVPMLLVGPGIYRNMYESNKEAGMDDAEASEDALNQFWSIVEETQQSGSLKNRAVWFRMGPWASAAAQFTSTSSQYLNFEVLAARDLQARAPGARGRAIETLFLTHVVLPGVYNLAKQAYDMLVLGDEWDEDDVWTLVISMIMGPWSALVVLGGVIEQTTRTLITGKKPWKGQDIPAVGNAVGVMINLVMILRNAGEMDLKGAQEEFDRLLMRLSPPYRDIRRHMENR